MLGVEFPEKIRVSGHAVVRAKFPFMLPMKKAANSLMREDAAGNLRRRQWLMPIKAFRRTEAAWRNGNEKN